MIEPKVVCVLGCRSTSATLERRVLAAGRAYFDRGAELVVACGGRAWDGKVEADAIADRLRALGVPGRAIVRERCSVDTRDNARFAAAMLHRRGLRDVLLVTCHWHMPRASMLFRATGLRVEEMGVAFPAATLAHRLYVRGRETLTHFRDARRGVELS